jgi:hypothetical protein
MKYLHVYDIVTEEGKTLEDIVHLHMSDDFDWVDVFEKLEQVGLVGIESYSYKVVDTE